MSIAQISSLTFVVMYAVEVFSYVNTTYYIVQVFSLSPVDSLINILCLHANFRHGMIIYSLFCKKCHKKLRSIGGTPFVTDEKYDHDKDYKRGTDNKTNTHTANMEYGNDACDTNVQI